MGKVCENISPGLADWIKNQRLFFVATSPLSPSGHINTSPKGGDALRVLGPLEVAYQDYTGSGAESAAHIRENGRVVLMFCAFEGPPRIVRLHGLGTIVVPGDARYTGMSAYFPTNPGTRAIVHIAVSRVSDSCGFSVPTFEFQGNRDTLDRWATQKGPEELQRYRAEKNHRSIDGLPAFDILRGRHMKVMTTVALGILLALALIPASLAAEAVEPAAMQTAPSASTMDLRELIHAVGKRSRIRFLIDPRIKAAVDTGSIAARDVTYPILLSILHIHGFAAISEGDIVMVVVDANVRTMAPPLVSPDNIKGEDAEIVTTIIPLASANAATLAQVLRPMVAQYGHLAPLPDRNALLLTDRVLNVKRLVTIIREAEKLPAQE